MRGWNWGLRLLGYGALVLVVNAMMGQAVAQTRILALGDSLTAGYGLPAGQGFADQLEAALKAKGYDVRVLNAGVSGDTTSGGLARLDWALADEPQIAIVELGANDGLRGLDPELTYRNLDQILTRLQAKGIAVVLAGMLAPPNYGKPYAEQFREVYRRLAARHQVVFYPFFLDGVAGQPGLNQPDGIHPTREGVAVIVERMLPVVAKVLEGGKG